ncbi:AMP-binding protein [Streptomyces sp. NBC_01518]|uniref:AMP-binding protein n=1 Tax=Streptomyces sp. NBC_01518 TaxID=2903891 RepID=UPI00386F4815
MLMKDLFERFGVNQTSQIVEISTSGSRREMTYAELAEAARQRADLLREAGVRQGQTIGLRGPNGIDWVLWDLAALRAGAVVQAFPDEMRPSDTEEFLVRHGLALLITDEPVAHAHRSVVTWDGTGDRSAIALDSPRTADPDLHSLVYSSGTTGGLKGLKVSRRGTEYVIRRFLESFPVGADDRHLIFLPLANYQQRLSVYCCLWTGSDLVLAPYGRVFTVLREEQPTFLIAPPVFYETLLHLHRKAQTPVSLPEFIGSRMKFMITGMAPIRAETVEAYRAADVALLEAYGMTESGMIAWNTPENHRAGSVGRLIDPDCVEFLPDGELLIRRAMPLSTGYFETPRAVEEETYRPDGAIATGDFGSLDPDGFLVLSGRKKDLITLGSGRKVHPVEVERLFARLPGVADIVVVPAPGANRLGALVTALEPGNRDTEDGIRKEIADLNTTVDSYQRIVSIVFTRTSVRTEASFMTANMKLSRKAATEHFAELLAAADKPTAVEEA